MKLWTAVFGFIAFPLDTRFIKLICPGNGIYFMDLTIWNNNCQAVLEITPKR